MQKIVSVGFLLLLLVVAPLGSWYYLKSGFSYQKSVFDELIPLGVLSGDRLPNNITEEGKKTIYLIALLDESKEYIGYEKIAKQFSETEYLQLLCLSNTDTTRNSIALKAELDKTKQKRIELENEKLIPFSDSDEYFALIDTNFMVKGVYDLSETSLKRMVEHTTILLPYKYESKR